MGFKTILFSPSNLPLKLSSLEHEVIEIAKTMVVNSVIFCKNLVFIVLFVFNYLIVGHPSFWVALLLYLSSLSGMG